MYIYADKMYIIMYIIYIFIHMRYLIHLYLLNPAHIISTHGAFQEMTPGCHEAVHWHLHTHAEPRRRTAHSSRWDCPACDMDSM